MTMNPTDLRKKRMIEEIRDYPMPVSPTADDIKSLVLYLIHDLLDWSPEALDEITEDINLVHLRDERP